MVALKPGTTQTDWYIRMCLEMTREHQLEVVKGMKKEMRLINQEPRSSGVFAQIRYSKSGKHPTKLNVLATANNVPPKKVIPQRLRPVQSLEDLLKPENLFVAIPAATVVLIKYLDEVNKLNKKSKALFEIQRNLEHLLD